MLAIELARLAHETRCRDVVILNIAKASAVADYFVIATGTSSRQMRTVLAKMEDFLRENKDHPALGKEGMTSDRWALLDLVDIVVHVFAPESRSFYDLELLWGDVPRVDWQEGYKPPAAYIE